MAARLLLSLPRSLQASNPVCRESETLSVSGHAMGFVLQVCNSSDKELLEFAVVVACPASERAIKLVDLCLPQLPATHFPDHRFSNINVQRVAERDQENTLVVSAVGPKSPSQRGKDDMQCVCHVTERSRSKSPVNKQSITYREV